MQRSDEAALPLADALDALPEGILVFDAAGRLMLWNRRYAEFYGHAAGSLRIGASFAELVRGIAFSGRVPDASGREEDWILERTRHHSGPASAFEHRLSDGRWIRVEEKRTPNGLSVGLRIDITDLKGREASFRLLFESNPVPILVYDGDDLRIRAANDAAVQLLGHARAALLRSGMGDLCAAGRSARLVDGMPWSCRRVDGRTIDLLPYSSDFVRDGRPAVITALVDVTEVRRGRDELHRTQAFLDSVIDTIPSIVFAKDMQDDGRYVLYNRWGRSSRHGPGEDLLGRTDLDVFPPDLAAFLRERDVEVATRGEAQQYEHTFPGRDGTTRLLQTHKVPIPGRPGEPSRYVLGIADDITDRREMERRLARAARRDDLTGLPNRLDFVEMLADALSACRQGPDGAAVLLVDIDGFRLLNDALGQRMGDAMLKAVAERLAAGMRVGDHLARISADVFAVVQSGVASAAEAQSFAMRLLDAFRTPFSIAGQDLTAGASIGIATTFVGGRPEPDAVLRQAELALGRAKGGDRGGLVFFEPRMDDEVRLRRALEHDLRGALDRDEFELFYQPQVDLGTEAVSGFEALIRWRHPVRGSVLPCGFIPAAEETGLIAAIGAWVLMRACADAASWPGAARVAVNLSPVQFLAPGLMEAVAAALDASGLPPERLELEITESVRLIDNDANLAMLHRLREIGIQVALDDFGTGYASLSYLRAFPFSKIKIDRSFVAGLGHDEGSLAIVRATTSLARDLGMDTIAEGVETPLQVLQLRQLGCAVGQGYLFGKPVPTGEVAATLGAARRRAI